MAHFMTLDLDDTLNRIERLADAFNKETDNLKCYAILVTIKKKLEDQVKDLENTMDNLNLNLIVYAEATKLINVKKSKKK